MTEFECALEALMPRPEQHSSLWPAIAKRIGTRDAKQVQHYAAVRQKAIRGEGQENSAVPAYIAAFQKQCTASRTGERSCGSPPADAPISPREVEGSQDGQKVRA